MCRKVILFFVGIVTALVPHAELSKAGREAVMDVLNRRLAVTVTPADSVDVLYDLYDVSPVTTRAEVGELLYATARRAGNVAAQLDVSRRLAEYYTNTDTLRLRQILRDVTLLPKSSEREATESFVYLSLVASQAACATESERQAHIVALMERSKSKDQLSEYERVELLFSVCNYLDITLPGELLVNYFARLGQELNKLPFRLDELDNMYYLQSAVFYSANNEPEKALAADRKLLKRFDNMVDVGRRQGRRYCNYDMEQYACYRRMLSNYQALTSKEVDDYYHKILALAVRNDDVRREFNDRQRSTIYYLMANKRYSEALSLLEAKVDEPVNEPYRLQLYRMMLEAATAVDNKADMLKAALLYNDVLKGYMVKKSANLTRELQVMYDVSTLQAENAQLALMQHDNELTWHKAVFVGSLVAILGLVVFVGLLFMSYRKARKLSVSLVDANRQLMEERDNLNRTQKELIDARDRARKADRHKTEFISNMSHEVRTPLNAIVECSHLIVDNLDDDKRKYLERYAQIVDVSADMLRTLVNDVLEISSVDNNTAVVQRNPVSVNTLCDVALESVARKLKPEVQLRFANEGMPDESINTDARRVEQVLINLLSNGVKFTDEGYVELSYVIDRNAGTVTFAVADTGIGIPDGKEDVIFERFEKLSNMTQGTGLGLNVCRLVAGLLHGEVKVDTSYPGPGARFVFTIPI